MSIEDENIEKPCTIDSVVHSYLDIRVNGAGTIRVSESSEWICGGEEGFSFGVSWGGHGYAGGTMPKEEARKLANHILKTLGD